MNLDTLSYFQDELYTPEFSQCMEQLPTNYVMKVGTDCSGIDSILVALTYLGIKWEQEWSCEIDSKCRETCLLNFPPPKICFNDITTRDHSKLPAIDLYVCGFPCQSFSTLGKKMGVNDPRGQIFPHCVETIKATQPKYFILENVRGLKNIDHGKVFESYLQQLKDIGTYDIQWKILNTKDYGIPQNRPRIYIIGILSDSIMLPYTFPDPRPPKTTVSDIMEILPYDDLDRLTPKMKLVIENRMGRKGFVDFRWDQITHYNWLINLACSVKPFGGQGGFGSAMWEQCPCLLATHFTYYSTLHQRFLLDREYLKLQGFPSNFKYNCSNTQFHKQLGNAMSVNVLCFILREIMLICDFVVSHDMAEFSST